EFNKYISLASSPELRFIISNTTEAGISYDQNDTFEMTPQQSFPAKVTSFLYKRFQHFKGAPDKGIILICCELIDRNADNLHKLVNRYIEQWGLEESFKTWIDTSCAFCNSLVDRIVPGYPREEAPALCEKLGYEDQLITVGEYFHLWVIEAPEWVRKEFPAPAAGLDVRFVDDMTAYRERKVRVLNGAHTGTVALSLLSGIGTVRESIEDPVLGGFMRKMVYDEILLPLEGDKEDLKVFADRILERFYNPFVKHQWTSIALNSLSKWVTRNEPSLVDYYHKTGKAPQCLTLSLAALILYYRGSYQGKSFTPQDDAINIQVMDQAWEKYNTHHSIHLLLKDIFENGSWWNKNLLKEIPELSAALEQCIKELLNNPAKDVISKIAQLS
ncbi:MAG: tagaturonate reductase, partial [Bacteroidota bacterium]|nr:tagaturonate reductase [Bacteroidota bacterium]